MKTTQSCGRGLEEHSALPAKLAELLDSVALVLDFHMKALDLTDESSNKELEAYRRLTNEHLEVAAQLHMTATEMAGYRDLPMGRHDPKAIAAPAAVDAFEKFVKIEQELVTLLERRVKKDRQMLIQMRAAGGAR